MTEKKPETITTKIWREEAEPDNPFAAARCYCAGYDVFGDLLGKISWVEYLFLLFRLAPPNLTQKELLENLAVALANPGPRDHSVRAAMNAGVSGSTRASALMAAIAVGAGNLGGAREVFWAVKYWQDCGCDLDCWQQYISNPPSEDRIDVWTALEHPPGFDPNGESCPTPVKQLLVYFAKISPDSNLAWLFNNRKRLEGFSGAPISVSGVAAAVLFSLGFSPEQAELLYMILRLPGAAAHALEQEEYGWQRYPFFGDGLKLLEEQAE